MYLFWQFEIWNSLLCNSSFFTNAQSWQCWHYFLICISIHLQFSSLFAPTDVSKCEIRNQWVCEDYGFVKNSTVRLSYDDFCFCVLRRFSETVVLARLLGKQISKMFVYGCSWKKNPLRIENSLWHKVSLKAKFIKVDKG